MAPSQSVVSMNVVVCLLSNKHHVKVKPAANTLAFTGSRECTQIILWTTLWKKDFSFNKYFNMLCLYFTVMKLNYNTDK